MLFVCPVSLVLVFNEPGSSQQENKQYYIKFGATSALGGYTIRVRRIRVIRATAFRIPLIQKDLNQEWEDGGKKRVDGHFLPSSHAGKAFRWHPNHQLPC